MAWFTISAAFFRFLLSGLDERHLAAVLLENDKILPSGLLLSSQSHPVATTQRRFRLNFWNLGRIAVPLHRQSDKTSITIKNKKIMAKTRIMVKQVLMSIVTLVSFVMAQYEDFSRVASIGSGLVGNSYYSSEA